MIRKAYVEPRLVLSPVYFDRALEEFGGDIFLGSEDSMYDADKVDALHRGSAGPEAVDLERMSGNRRVLSHIERMLSQQERVFFPGTLLRDFGGYIVPVMPVIFNGKLTSERIKQTREAIIDDYSRLAQERGMTPPKVNGFSDDNYNALVDSVKTELDKRKKDSLHPCLIGDIAILPVIGNELSIMPSLYKGQKVSAVFHSAVNYFGSDEERLNRYTEFAKAMQERGLVNNHFTIVYSEHSSGENEMPSARGAFVYEGGRLRSLNDFTSAGFTF